MRRQESPLVRANYAETRARPRRNNARAFVDRRERYAPTLKSSGYKRFQGGSRAITFYIRPGSAPVVHTLKLTRCSLTHRPPSLSFSLSLSLRTEPYSRRARSLAHDVPFSLSRALCLELGLSRLPAEFYDPPRRRKLEISHVKVDTAGRVARGTRGALRDVGGATTEKLRR